MTWVWITRHDVTDIGKARRTPLLLGLLIIVFVIEISIRYLLGDEVTSRTITTVSFRWLPLIGLMVGYDALVADRHGRRDQLQVLPVSRQHILSAMLVSRSLITAGIVVGALLSAGAYILLIGGTLGLVDFIWFIVFFVLIAVGATVFAVAVSAAVKSKNWAVGIVIGAYGWYSFNTFLSVSYPEDLYRWVGLSPPDPILEPSGLYYFLGYLNPHYSLYIVGDLYFPTDISRPWGPSRLQPQPELPIYADEWVTVIILLAWVVVPLFIAYRNM